MAELNYFLCFLMEIFLRKVINHKLNILPQKFFYISTFLLRKRYIESNDHFLSVIDLTEIKLIYKFPNSFSNLIHAHFFNKWVEYFCLFYLHTCLSHSHAYFLYFQNYLTYLHTYIPHLHTSLLYSRTYFP